MPTDTVWVVITIPRKEFERELRRLKIQNNFNKNKDEFINSGRKQKEKDNFIEKVLSDTLEELQIEDVVWIPTRNGNSYQVYFPCELCENDAILGILKSKGIGTKPETSIGYIPFNLFYTDENSESDAETYDTSDFNDGIPGNKNGKKMNIKKPVNIFKEATNDFLKSVTSRLTVAQVVEGVRSGATITFDFSAYTLMAAFICAFAIFSNDPVNIAASMMIEPVMGTVMAMTFGIVVHDKQLFWLGVKNNIISLMMCMIPGYVIGCIFMIWMTQWNPTPTGVWPPPQMQGRGTYEGLIYGVLIALPCGGAVAVSLLNSNYGALVGVAVASTFQPPFVNTGLEWALATHLQVRGLYQDTVPYNISGQIFYMKPAWAPQAGYTPVYSYDMRIENALLGCVSMALTGLNVVCMLVVAVITLWIKEVSPLNKLEQISPGSQRFFKQDIRIAREYNKKHTNDEFQEPLGTRILMEWAEIAGIDKKQFLDSSPEARITQMQTLYDIIKDVERDETYKNITQNSRGNANNNMSLARRLTKPIIHVYNAETSQGPTHNPGLWNIDAEMSRAMHASRTGERSRIVDEDESPYSTIGYARGLKTSELLAERGRRKSSQFLKHALRYSTRSPYSVWPGAQPKQKRSDSFDIYNNNAGVRHRPNTNYGFEPDTATTNF